MIDHEPLSPDEARPSTDTDTDTDIHPDLAVRVERVGATVLVTLRGELDAATEPLLVDAVDGHVDGSCDDLIVSCKELTFVDSSGLRALLTLRASCAGTDTRFHLVHTSPQVERLIEITGLTRAFH
jgi:anti-sigma B factor antagonist